MPFRIKDLMIQVIGEEICFQPTLVERCYNATCRISFGCMHLSMCNFTNHPNIVCLPTFQPCGGTVTPCGGTIVDPTVLAETDLIQFSPTDLHQLRVQLQTALANLEKREKAQEVEMRPRTKAEADVLESKLKGALEELQKQKKDLK